MIHTLHIGINDYPGTGSDLAGCVNDARDMAAMFKPVAESQKTLLDGKASRAAILLSIGAMLSKLGPSDMGMITFSGHGTFVTDTSGDEPDGRDEALVPADLKLIYDDEFKQLLSARDPKARLFVVTDSCHSGTVHRAFNSPRVRFLPVTRIAGGIPLRRKGKPKVGKQAALPNVIHFSGCMDSEFSYEASANGALTAALMQSFARLKPKGTFGQWFKLLGEYLPASDYPQTPCCNANAAALRWQVPGKAEA